MRNTLFTIALGGMLVVGMNAALYAQDNSTAQDNSMQAPVQGEQGHGRGMNPDRQLEHMTRQLDLTADQQTQIKPILLERQQKMQALWQDQSLSQQDRRSQMRTIQQDAHSRIEAVLNDQQKQKFEAMQERMREHRQQGMQGGDNQPPTSSPQPQ